MKVSVITVVLNNREHLEDCLNSVFLQSYGDIEHIIIDGGSTDGTIDVIKKYEKRLSLWISEPDRGLYDAMNKGILKSSGDVIGILNSDDMYADEKVIEKVVGCFSNTSADSCYGDLVYVDRNAIHQVRRCWKAGGYYKNNFHKGWMPPHPTFFVRRKIYKKYSGFNLDFPLAADYELMLRLLYGQNVSTVYLPECLVKMRTGGKSHPGLSNIFHNMAENYRAWKINGLKTNPLTFILKPLLKTMQYIQIQS